MTLEHTDEKLISDISRVLDVGMGVLEFKTKEDARNHITGVRLIRSNPNLSDEEITAIEKEYDL